MGFLCLRPGVLMICSLFILLGFLSKQEKSKHKDFYIIFSMNEISLYNYFPILVEFLFIISSFVYIIFHHFGSSFLSCLLFCSLIFSVYFFILFYYVENKHQNDKIIDRIQIKYRNPILWIYIHCHPRQTRSKKQICTNKEKKTLLSNNNI